MLAGVTVFGPAAKEILPRDFLDMPMIGACARRTCRPDLRKHVKQGLTAAQRLARHLGPSWVVRIDTTLNLHVRDREDGKYDSAWQQLFREGVELVKRVVHELGPARRVAYKGQWWSGFADVHHVARGPAVVTLTVSPGGIEELFSDIEAETSMHIGQACGG